MEQVYKRVVRVYSWAIAVFVHSHLFLAYVGCLVLAFQFLYLAYLLDFLCLWGFGIVLELMPTVACIVQNTLFTFANIFR